SQPFLEALRQLRNEEGQDNVMFVHVTFVPHLSAAGEFKTKPTQHSTKELRSTGIAPDMIVCRSEKPIDKNLKKKIAHFCDVPFHAVVNTPDAPTIYEVPLVMDRENVGYYVNHRLKLNLDTDSSNLDQWREVVEAIKKQEPVVTIGIVGKYIELEDSYISIKEALIHAGGKVGVHVNVEFITSDVDTLDTGLLEDLDGILIPGGFGERGIEGKLEAVEYAIENNVPIFGICLGLHAMVIQFARRIGLEGANSSEFDQNNKYPVIDMMEEQKKIKEMGGTMRLGSYDCKIDKDTLAYKAYGKDLITERHRHRFEVNNDYKDQLVEGGLTLSGFSPDGFLVEMIELKDHPWFLGCQFHPEFKSRPNNAHPLFASFIEAAYNHSKKE
ncbi:MAG: CTP synthase (glutamine hydrolyzing), partial [Methanobrevibacter sp.]|nr:CTP synthase (glutamine hydrolyzing) [Methanobrevibacter sp.]